MDRFSDLGNRRVDKTFCYISCSETAVYWQSLRARLARYLPEYGHCVLLPICFFIFSLKHTEPVCFKFIKLEDIFVILSYRYV